MCLSHDDPVDSLSRDSPTKLDREVLSALEGVDIDPLKFPSIQKWKSTMKAYSASDMQRSVDVLVAVAEWAGLSFWGNVLHANSRLDSFAALCHPAGQAPPLPWPDLDSGRNTKHRARRSAP